MVLDPNGAEFRDEQKRKLLMGRAMPQMTVHLWVRSEVKLRGICADKNALEQNRIFSAAEISHALMRLHHDTKLCSAAKLRRWRFWQKLRSRAIGLIDNAPQTESERLGLDLTSFVPRYTMSPKIFSRRSLQSYARTILFARVGDSATFSSAGVAGRLEQ